MNLCLGCMEKIHDTDSQCPFCGHAVGTTAENALREGTILACKYVVGKELAHNTLLTTYIGFDAEAEKKVIIKEYFPRTFATRDADSGNISVSSAERSSDYVCALNQLSAEYNMQQRFHGMGCIADICEVVTANNTLYAIIGFIEGTTVADTLDGNTIAFNSALDVIINLAKTLSPLHKSGAVHCNICPTNIMIDNNAAVKLLDFGSARYKMGLNRNELADILKAGYAPVELTMNLKDITAATDVYSLAAVMYKMITGVTPPSATERIEKDTLSLPTALGAKISVSAENAILNALNVYPEDRTQTVADFIDELTAEQTMRREPRRRDRSGGKVPLWLKIAAPILGVALIVLLSVWLGFFQKLNFGTIRSADVQVPNVISKNVSDAEKLLNQNRLNMQIATNKLESDIVEKDTILAQDIKSGQLMEVGSVVTVTVSAGKPEPVPTEDPVSHLVTIPDVQYKTETDAVAMLEALGLTIDKGYENSTAVPFGNIIRQSPAVGEQAEKGSKIVIIISSGASEPTITKAPATKNNAKKSTNKSNQSTKQPESTPTTDNSGTTYQHDHIQSGTSTNNTAPYSAPRTNPIQPQPTQPPAPTQAAPAPAPSQAPAQAQAPTQAAPAIPPPVQPENRM